MRRRPQIGTGHRRCRQPRRGAMAPVQARRRGATGLRQRLTFMAHSGNLHQWHPTSGALALQRPPLQKLEPVVRDSLQKRGNPLFHIFISDPRRLPQFFQRKRQAFCARKAGIKKPALGPAFAAVRSQPDGLLCSRFLLLVSRSLFSGRSSLVSRGSSRSLLGRSSSRSLFSGRSGNRSRSFGSSSRGFRLLVTSGDGDGEQSGNQEGVLHFLKSFICAKLNRKQLAERPARPACPSISAQCYSASRRATSLGGSATSLRS